MAKRNTYFEDEVVMKKIDMKQLFKVFRYICPYKKTVVLVVFLMLFSAGISMLSPLLLKQIINVVVVKEDYRMLAYAIVLILVMLATNSPALKGFFARFFRRKEDKTEKGGAQ